MKTQLQRTDPQPGSRSSLRLDAGIRSLFRRCPMLCGFAVREDSGLFVSEVTVDPRGGRHSAGVLHSEIAAALLEVIDECPEARGLLRERTFARAFH